MRRAIASGLMVAIAACGDPGHEDDIPATAVDHDYVANTLATPENAAQVMQFAMDLDGDPQGIPDNQLGNALATLAQQGIGLQGSIASSVAEGRFVLLGRVRADLALGGGASWQLYLGEMTVGPPDFGGSGEFVVAADSPVDAVLPGAVSDGQFTGGPGDVRLELPLVDGVPPIPVHLVGSRISGAISEAGCDVKLGGGVTETELRAVVIPAWVDAMNYVVATTPGCFDVPPQCDIDTMNLLDVFDRNDDAIITVEEVLENSLIRAFLVPDLDLLDVDGAYDPGSDGAADSVSFGARLTCVGAAF